MSTVQVGRRIGAVVAVALLTAGIGCSGDEAVPSAQADHRSRGSVHGDHGSTQDDHGSAPGDHDSEGPGHGDRRSQDTRPTVPADIRLPPTPEPTSTTSSPLEQRLRKLTERFYDALGEAYRTLDPTTFEPLLAPKSRAGETYTRAIRELKSKGHRFAVGPEMKVVSFRLEDDDRAKARATATVRTSDSAIVDSEGRTIDQAPPRFSQVRIRFTKKEGAWLIESQDFESG